MHPSSNKRLIGRLAVLLALALGASACSRCGGDDKPPAPLVVAEPPVPAPEGLVAEIVVPTPNASWGQLQRGIGGAVGILPSTLGGIICAFAALDAGLGPEIDGLSPLYGAVAGDPAKPEWAFAVKLTDLRKARALLLDGDVARYTARDVGTITELVPRGAPPPVSVALTKGGYLVVASNGEALGDLGPYVSRTLTTRAVTSKAAIDVDVPRSFFAHLKPWAESKWSRFRADKLAQDDKMRAAHDGREPDFADPKAIVGAFDTAIGQKLAVLSDVDHAKVTVHVTDGQLRARFDATPIAGSGPASQYVAALSVGDSAPLIDAPADAPVVAMLREAKTARAADATEWKASIKSVLGARVTELDAKKISGVVDDWTAGRSDVLVLGGFTGPTGLFARASVADADAASRSVSGAVDLMSMPLFREAAKIRSVKVEKADVAEIGQVNVATLERDQPKRAAPLRGPSLTDTKPVGLAWRVADGLTVVGLGEAPADLVKHAAKPPRKLGDDPVLRAALGAVGGDLTALLIAQPLLFDAKRAALPASPVVLAAGRHGKDGFVELVVADVVLRELARRELGL